MSLSFDAVAMAAASKNTALRTMLKRDKTQKGKHYVVAVDGSDLCKRAVRLAAFLAKPFDRISFITVSKGGDVLSFDDYTAIITPLAAMSALKKPTPKDCEVVPMADGANISETLVNYLNEKYPSSILLLGAAGRGIQDSEKSKGARPSGEAPMGSVAKACLGRFLGPVFLVKKKATPDLHKDEFLKNRHYATGKPSSAHLLCCIDDDETLSKRCFDYATHMAKRGDVISVLYVRDTEKEFTATTLATPRTSMLNYFSDEVDKANSNGKGISFVMLKPYKVSTIPSTILAHVDPPHDAPVKHPKTGAELPPVDMVIMGSIKLAKADTDETLGSVSKYVCERTEAHPVIVKNYASSGLC